MAATTDSPFELSLIKPNVAQRVGDFQIEMNNIPIQYTNYTQ